MAEREAVVVVGAGGAGCLTALRLAARGLSVVLIERAPEEPSLTAICGGLVPAVGTRQQAALGIDDSIDRFAVDVLAKNQGQADPALVRRWRPSPLRRSSSSARSRARPCISTPTSCIPG